MADKRAFANFDVGYLQNPKLSAMRDAMPTALQGAYATAVLAHIQSVLYASQHLTDGVVSPRLIIALVDAPEETEEMLIECGLWHAPGHNCPDCPQPPDKRVYVHNYLEHNRSKASASGKSEQAREAALKRWADAPSNAERNASGNANSNASGNAKKERKNNTPPTPSQEIQDAFKEWWEYYPKKVDKGKALKAFKSALQKTSLDTLKRAAESYAVQTEGKDRQYIKNPSTWLNAESWDNPEEQPPSQKPSTFDPWAGDWSEDDYRK